MESTRPTHVQVANHFYHDAIDLHARYIVCEASESPEFYSSKSRRMKCFIDLRMAMESALKSVVTYYCHSDKQGEKLVKKVENYRHHIEKLIGKALEHLPEEDRDRTDTLCKQLHNLPVGLRYRLDVMDFKRNNEKLYGDTVGSDDWMKSTSETIKSIADFIGKELNKESRVLSSGELKEEYFATKYDKYSK
ncbi:MAG: hypothetical protein OQK12_00670 [Motiliproteus sp.]|uniref:hypothetical protein n=1 Tax=Porticoccus sp. TaxID=2024853 RepID=UPI000C627DFE|nr:hypothetical protein [Porticoccus sp.]MAZ69121.1 hypothetical protein [Porticoccus sp.]MCW8883748.1 hypothetical protein [Motiliproteus sp.]MCW9050913.1 hypothetical protein [Motiliproteus sp.]|tara:strand:+ start:15660 stop:16235 length:576 start_codon:yes stop_codon:yes gene_type:complete